MILISKKKCSISIPVPGRKTEDAARRTPPWNDGNAGSMQDGWTPLCSVNMTVSPPLSPLLPLHFSAANSYYAPCILHPPSFLPQSVMDRCSKANSSKEVDRRTRTPMHLEFREEMKIFRRLWSTDISERPSSEVLASLKWKIMSAKRDDEYVGQTG